MRKCKDCHTSIQHRHGTAKRCKECAKESKRRQKRQAYNALPKHKRCTKEGKEKTRIYMRRKGIVRRLDEPGAHVAYRVSNRLKELGEPRLARLCKKGWPEYEGVRPAGVRIKRLDECGPQHARIRLNERLKEIGESTNLFGIKKKPPKGFREVGRAHMWVRMKNALPRYADNIERFRKALREKEKRVRRGGSTAIVRRRRQRILSRFKGRCAYCSDLLDENWHLDHVHPASKGGRSTIDNLVPACPCCNYDKSDSTLHEWISRRLNDPT